MYIISCIILYNLNYSAILLLDVEEFYDFIEINKLVIYQDNYSGFQFNSLILFLESLHDKLVIRRWTNNNFILLDAINYIFRKRMKMDILPVIIDYFNKDSNTFDNNRRDFILKKFGYTFDHLLILSICIL